MGSRGGAARAGPGAHAAVDGGRGAGSAVVSAAAPRCPSRSHEAGGWLALEASKCGDAC